MRKVIFILCFLLAFFLCYSSSSSIQGFAFEQRSLQNSLTEWEEYVLIDGQWYKIIHLDDGSDIIQATHGTGGD